MKLSGIRANWQRLHQSAVFFGVFASGIRVGANVLLLPLPVLHGEMVWLAAMSAGHLLLTMALFTRCCSAPPADCRQTEIGRSVSLRFGLHRAASTNS